MIQSLTTEEIRKIVGDQQESKAEPVLIHHVIIDSRSMLQPEHTIFVALKGAKFDGHDFIPELFELGVKCFLVKDTYKIPKKLEGKIELIFVKDTRAGLQQIAAFQRSLFESPVISITGSNGKTIIKEWLGQVLAQKYAVAKSPKSYNSQVGVPLEYGHKKAMSQ